MKKKKRKKLISKQRRDHIDDFMKIRIRVGEIIACERGSKNRKITLLAGENRKSIKADCVRYQGHYTAEEMVGKSYGTCEFEACKACRGLHQSKNMLLCVQKMKMLLRFEVAPRKNNIIRHGNC